MFVPNEGYPELRKTGGGPISDPSTDVVEVR
jgi:hypothetical protein